MAIENLKRWHWALIGLLGGGLFGLVWSAMRAPADEGVFETLSQQRFEEHLRGRAESFGWGPLNQQRVNALRAQGVPLLRDLEVYPPDRRGRTWVTGEMLLKLKPVRIEPEQPDRILPAEATYQKFRFEPTAPYKPAFAAGAPVCVDVNWNPTLKFVNGSAQRQRLPRTPGWEMTGFTADTRPAMGGIYGIQTDPYREDPGWRDPAHGAELRFGLRAGTYRLVVHFDRTSGKKDEVKRLSVTLNDQPIGPFAQAQANDPFVWQATATVPQGEQLLWFTREGGPVHIGRVEMYDPTYTFAQYVADVRAKEPDASATYLDPRWRTPPMTIAIFALGGLVLVGGVWPTVVGLMVGAGFARPPRSTEPAYDLDRFGKGPDPAMATVKAEPTPEQEGALTSRLEQLEEELLSNLRKSDAARREEPEEVAPVRDLKATPAEPPAALADDAARDVAYTGEYYPVATKGTAKREDGASGEGQTNARR